MGQSVLAGHLSSRLQICTADNNHCRRAQEAGRAQEGRAREHLVREGAAAQTRGRPGGSSRGQGMPFGRHVPTAAALGCDHCQPFAPHPPWPCGTLSTSDVVGSTPQLPDLDGTAAQRTRQFCICITQDTCWPAFGETEDFGVGSVATCRSSNVQQNNTVGYHYPYTRPTFRFPSQMAATLEYHTSVTISIMTHNIMCPAEKAQPSAKRMMMYIHQSAPCSMHQTNKGK